MDVLWHGVAEMMWNERRKEDEMDERMSETIVPIRLLTDLQAFGLGEVNY